MGPSLFNLRHWAPILARFQLVSRKSGAGIDSIKYPEAIKEYDVHYKGLKHNVKSQLNKAERVCNHLGIIIWQMLLQSDGGLVLQAHHGFNMGKYCARGSSMLNSHYQRQRQYNSDLRSSFCAVNAATSLRRSTIVLSAVSLSVRNCWSFLLSSSISAFSFFSESCCDFFRVLTTG